MLDLPKNRILSPKPSWTVSLNDYVTAIAWVSQTNQSSESDLLAMASASGEVQVGSSSKDLRILRSESNESVDVLKFSGSSDNWLAAAGQEGKVYVWNLEENPIGHSINQPIMSLDLGNAWIDNLVWQPPQKISNGAPSSSFAFSLGKYVQVWNVETEDIVTTVDFENSAVRSVAWHGDSLAVGGYQGVKIWNALDWDNDPYFLSIPTVVKAIAWNNQGNCLLIATGDETVIFLDYADSGSQEDKYSLSPFQLKGFPTSIKAIAWADSGDTFAVASGAEISMWKLCSNRDRGWEAEISNHKLDSINVLEFQPQTKILASAGVNGKVSLVKGSTILQTLNVNAEVTCLKWHPQGNKLAVGTAEGKVVVWDIAKKSSGKGFWA